MIEAGKFYRTRSGRKVGPMRKEGPADRSWVGTIEGYTLPSLFCEGVPGEDTLAFLCAPGHGESEYDLIAEWDIPPWGPETLAPELRPFHKPSAGSFQIRTASGEMKEAHLVDVVKKLNGFDAGLVIKDPVDHPSHYTAGTIECFDAMKAMLSKEELIGYLRGNSFKYRWRWRQKGGVEDLRKAEWYEKKLIEIVEA